MTDKITLLPCPFCGGDAYMTNANMMYSVRCSECGAEGARYGLDFKATKAWNARVEESWRAES